MAAIPPENDQPLDAMTGDERRAHALQHGFVMDDFLADLDFAGDRFPWEHVQASSHSRALQARHPVTEGKSRYLANAKPCSRCQTPAGALSWFYFESPPWTWENMCGSAGWMVVCDACSLQTNYFEEVMN